MLHHRSLRWKIKIIKWPYNTGPLAMTFDFVLINLPSYQRARRFIPCEGQQKTHSVPRWAQCSPLVVWNYQVEQKTLREMAGWTGAFPSPDKHGSLQREHNVWWHCPNCSKQSYKYTSRVGRSKSSSSLLDHFVPARKNKMKMPANLKSCFCWFCGRYQSNQRDRNRLPKKDDALECSFKKQKKK